MRKFIYFTQYLFFRGLVYILQSLPLNLVANYCAAFCRVVGPKLKVSKVALKNFELVYPKMDCAAKNKLLTDCWDNYGRFIAEFAHIGKLSLEEFNQHISFVGLENIQQLIDSNSPFLIATGHFANWDFALHSFQNFATTLGVVYRKLNNPYIDNYVAKTRSMNGKVNLISKGADGARRIIQSLKSKQSIALLIDQKMNDGIDVPFFGYEVKTAPAIARFSYQFNYPIIPMQISRKKGSNFLITIEKPIEIDHSLPKEEAILKGMIAVNQVVEKWVLARPQEWFWFHKRWPKEFYR